MHSHRSHARVPRCIAAAAAAIALFLLLSACQMAQRASPARSSSAPEYPELGQFLGQIFAALADGF